jgi:spermidine/putrescine-binding protein
MSTAHADGELNIYNWGNYTSPELIKKFEKTYNVKVTLTDYDSNDTALAKIRAGGHGFDIVVPSANFVPIWVNEGLLLESRPDQMENFKNMDERWVDVPSLYRAMAVGHDRPRCRHRGLQWRLQYAGNLARSPTGTCGKDQRRS